MTTTEKAISRIETEMSDLRLDIQNVFDANDTHLLATLRARLSGLQTALDICLEAELTEQEAKAFLTEQGFYTDILWCIEDVQNNYECTEQEAQHVLHGALNNEATMEQIWFAINYHAENDGLIKKEQEEEL